MIPTYAFVFIAIVLAIIVGRAGTILREYFEARKASSQRQHLSNDNTVIGGSKP